MTLIEIARWFRFVREIGGPNDGRWVRMIQKLTGNKPPDSWCASFVSLVVGIAYQGKPPLPYSASCDVLLTAARAQGLVVNTPASGDLFFYVHPPDDAHHVGIVTYVSSDKKAVNGIAGNTSRDGTSSNGDGVYEHAVDLSQYPVYVRLPSLGA
jgi:hypothetical protein